MTREEIIRKVEECVLWDRAATHGEPEDSFAVIAAYWEAYLFSRGVLEAGAHVNPSDVAAMMVLLKIARAGGNPGHADNWVDGAGYMVCGGELVSREAGS